MSKLRKPISAFLYSRLLTWANTIEKGLNPPRSFNSVSPVRNQPSGDPNCELFPQGLIIPIPPSTPLYRPVGIDGNNWVVFPGRDAKRKPSNQRVRGLLFPLFRWWLCPAAMPKQYQAVLGSTKTRVQKPVPAIPTRLLHSCMSWYLALYRPCRVIPCSIVRIKSESRVDSEGRGIVTESHVSRHFVCYDSLNRTWEL